MMDNSLILFIGKNFTPKIWNIASLLSDKSKSKIVFLTFGEVTHVANGSYYLKNLDSEEFKKTISKIQKRYKLLFNSVIIYNNIVNDELEEIEPYNHILKQIFELNHIFELVNLVNSEINPPQILNLICKPARFTINNHIFFESLKAIYHCLDKNFSQKFKEVVLSHNLSVEKETELIFNNLNEDEINQDNNFKYPYYNISSKDLPSSIEDKQFNKPLLIHNYKTEISSFINKMFPSNKHIFLKKDFFNLLSEFEYSGPAEIKKDLTSKDYLKGLENSYNEIDLLVHYCEDYSNYDIKKLTFDNLFNFMMMEIQSLWNLFNATKKIKINKLLIITHWNNKRKDVNYLLLHTFLGLCKGLKEFKMIQNTSIIAISNKLLREISDNNSFTNCAKALIDRILKNIKLLNTVVLTEDSIPLNEDYIRSYSQVSLNNPIHSSFVPSSVFAN